MATWAAQTLVCSGALSLALVAFSRFCDHYHMQDVAEWRAREVRVRQMQARANEGLTVWRDVRMQAMGDGTSAPYVVYELVTNEEAARRRLAQRDTFPDLSALRWHHAAYATRPIASMTIESARLVAAREAAEAERRRRWYGSPMTRDGRRQ